MQVNLRTDSKTSEIDQQSVLKKVIPLQSMQGKFEEKFSMKRLAKLTDLTKQNSQNITTDTIPDDQTGSMRNQVSSNVLPD